MIAYQLGWMNLVLDWESKEQQGITVVTPTPDYKWNNMCGLYESFYKKYDVYTLAELCYMFVETEKKIIQLINRYTDNELFQQGGKKWSSSTPLNFFEPNLYEPSLYSSPYNMPQRVVGIFLIYCFLSVIYWLIKKKINMVVHYSLIIAIYIAITVLYVIAVQSGI